MDTQLPRWEVFKQDSPNKPHQAVGSVHAADPQHALLTARNVFARRPQAVSMWVARAEDIFSWTKEQVEAGGGKREAKEQDFATRHLPPATCFLLFRKTSHKRSLTFMDYVGELETPSPEAALTQAILQFTDAEALAWWIIPASRVFKSQPDQETLESWFAPAGDKTYKQQSYYATIGSHVSKHKQGRDDHEQ